MSHEIKKIAILGLPNTGKSLTFNSLTKEYSVVANYPLTTIELKTAFCDIKGEKYEVIDTPGIHSFYIHCEEELQVRNMFFSQNPDIVIQCIDANRLKQSLTLTADLIELKVPFIICLNAIDETTKKGISINAIQLSELLGVPVVETFSINGIRRDEIKNALLKAQKSKAVIDYGFQIEENVQRIESLLPKGLHFRRKAALLLLLEDKYLKDTCEKFFDEKICQEIHRYIDGMRMSVKSGITRLIQKSRNDWIAEITKDVVHKREVLLKGFSHKFALLSRHPFWGIPIMLGFLFLMFVAVVDVANTMAEVMNNLFWIPFENLIRGFVSSGFWNEFLIGDYGVLTFGFSNAILTVLPILSVFFLLFNTLEDIGYMPNLVVLLKRIFEKFGLTGNAIMPITLGFGCKTMATLTTKTLKSKKERYIAIYLIAFALPCAPQMALNMSILGRLGIGAFLIAFFVLGMVEIFAGFVLNKILKDEKKSDFIQELPDIRMPQLKAVLKKTYYRLFWFLKEAIPIFMYSAVILFVTDKIGLLDVIKHYAKPVVTGFLGFPIGMVDVLILCLARQEAAAGMIIKLIQTGKMNYIQSIVAVVLTTMFVPCLANIVAMIKELGYKIGIFMVVWINITSIIIAGILNWILLLALHF